MSADRTKIPVAIIGSGNIGSDLMMKISKFSESLSVAVMVGIDPDSEGLARAREMGIVTTDAGIDSLTRMFEFAHVKFLFDATSAKAHAHHASIARSHHKVMIDLTPAAIGPFVVPPINISQHAMEPEINMVTCGGQATVPIVAAISALYPVAYAEIVASIASRSAGPGTRANIDEFTETTAKALRTVAKAESAKAIIVLNPAEPPGPMRDTVYVVIDRPLMSQERSEISQAVEAMVEEVSSYVPHYLLKQEVQFEDFDAQYVPALGREISGTKVSVFLEIRGSAQYLPSYAGNLDIMTSAAMQTAERIATIRGWIGLAVNA